MDPDRPGFFPQESTNELKQREEVFVEIQKAYVYLTNPLTKVIYDEFGIPGLAVYEKQKNKFADLQEEIRGIDSHGDLIVPDHEQL